MKKFLSLAVMCSLAFPAMAIAQPESPKVEEDEEMGAVEATTADAPATPALEEMPESPKVAADDMGAPEEGAHPAKENISWMAMASAFYRISGYIDDGIGSAQGRGSGVLPGQYNSLGYPYTNYNGFGLNFVGGDFQYTGKKFAIRIDLRFGEGAALLTPISASGFGGLKQGFVSWMPHDKVTIDFGFFDTVFGGEVVDEWNNANFTRGALYFNRQPFNHMGIRSAFALNDTVGFTLLVTNGGVLGGTPVDNNATPTLGWQFAFGFDDVGLYIGGQHGAGNDFDNKNWENFFDWVLTASAGKFTLIANGDYQTTPSAGLGDGSLLIAYGHSLQLIFDASDTISIGLRGEHLSGNEQYRLATGEPFLATGTATLRYKPVQYLVLSIEYRGEWTSKENRIYYSRAALDPTTGEVGSPDRRHNHAVIFGFTAYISN